MSKTIVFEHDQELLDHLVVVCKHATYFSG